MPATHQCPGCHAHLPARPAWDTCPRCTTALPARPPVPATIRTDAAGPRARSWLAGAVLALICVLVGLIAYRAIVPSPAQLRQRQVSQALAACQLALEQAAPGESPPYVKDFGSGGEFYFAWPTGSFYATTAGGHRTPLSASCIGDLASGTIRQLTLNGQDLR